MLKKIRSFDIQQFPNNHSQSHQFTWNIIKDHRTIQSGRDFSKSLVYPTQSRTSSGIKPSCSQLDSIQSWNPSRGKTSFHRAKPLDATCSTAWLSSGEKKKCYTQPEPFFFSLCPLSHSLRLCTTVSSPPPPPLWPLLSTEGLLGALIF